MKCPACKNTDLKATRLDDGLPAHGCEKCGGAIISLLYYREWAERTLNDQVSENASFKVAEVLENESHSALACPKCARLMTKFHIAGCTKSRLDLCTCCDEAWLDGGEWELLKALQLSKILPAVFTEAWQYKIRKEISELQLKERFEKIVGAVDIERAENIRTWLKGHEKRAELLFYMSQE